MSKFFLFVFSVLFLAVYPLAVEAAEISGDVKVSCPFGQPFFVGPMDPGKSFEILPGHTKIEKAKIEAHRQVLLQCLSQYGKRTKFNFVGMMDPLNYRGVRPEVHNALNGGLPITRATGGAKLAREAGYLNITTKEMYGNRGERGVLIIPDLGLCTAEEIGRATTISKEVVMKKSDGQEVVEKRVIPKGSCKAIVGQQLPAGRITKVFLSLPGEENFNGSEVAEGLPTTKSCYLMVGDGGRTPVRQNPPVVKQPEVVPVPVAKETKCSDGIDNDGDKMIDCADPDCEGSAVCGPEDTEARCRDNIDNDGDGFVDCDDKDCMETEPCKGKPPVTVVPAKKNGPSAMDKILGRIRFETTIAGMFFVPNQDALGGVEGLKTSDGLNTQVMFNLNIDLGKGFSLVPGVGASSFTRAYEAPNTDEDILTKDVRHWELRAQLVLLKQLAKNLEVGLGFGANINQADELLFVQGVLRYSLDDHLFVTGGVEVFFFTHPLDGSEVRVWAPFFGIGYRW